MRRGDSYLLQSEGRSMLLGSEGMAKQEGRSFRATCPQEDVIPRCSEEMEVSAKSGMDCTVNSVSIIQLCLVMVAQNGQHSPF